MPNLDKNKHLYNVDGQITNKKEFINRYVPKGCKIHLVGHSVGAYMALQLLKDDDVSFFGNKAMKWFTLVLSGLK